VTPPPHPGPAWHSTPNNFRGKSTRGNEKAEKSLLIQGSGLFDQSHKINKQTIAIIKMSRKMNFPHFENPPSEKKIVWTQ
jgi:hypothetical protein